MERFIAIDNVCAWPNLTLMPSGSIAATTFNQPAHGTCEGDVECWVSVDGGRFWERRGIPAPHEPGTNRMNVAAGLAHDGSLIVLASGWGGKGFRGEILPCWVCRSSDEGRTWTQTLGVSLPKGVPYLVPFGDILALPDGSLAAAAYGQHSRQGSNAYLLFSRDGGESWGDAALIACGDYNETALLWLKEGRMLAASRTQKDQHLELFVSQDQGRSWGDQGILTMPGQHPAHLSLLADGHVLLVYGIRNRGLYGIGARLSADGGESWSGPILLVNLEDATDGGYPSSVQWEDGTIVTAYYCNRIPAHARYHMGVLRWRIADIVKPA